MKRTYVIVAMVVLCASSSLFGARAKLVRSVDPVRGSYIVVFNDAVGSRTADVAAQMAARHHIQSPHLLMHALQGFTAHMTDKQVAALLRDPRVRFIEEDARVTPEASQTLPSFEWYALDRIDQRARLGPYPYTMTYNYCQDGTGVTVYVIDTGVWRDHVEFWTNGQSRVTGGADFTMGAQGTADNPCPNEVQYDCPSPSNLQNISHGTSVASIIGGSTYGVAKNVTIVPVRVFACEPYLAYNVTSLLWGIDWVTANHQSGTPAVANMSFAAAWNNSDNSALTYAVNNLVADGVTVVAAAGNFQRDACGYMPANNPNVITVGGSDHWDHRAVDPFNGDFGSNWGSCIDIFAPWAVSSADIWSCEDNYQPWHHNPQAQRVFGTVGTSFSTALVSGVAAQYLQTHPTATPAAVENWIKTNATAGALQTTNPELAGPNLLLYTACQ